METVDTMKKIGLLPPEFEKLADKFLALESENQRLAAQEKEWLIDKRIRELEDQVAALQKRLAHSVEFSDEFKRRMNGNWEVTIRERGGARFLKCVNLDTGRTYIEVEGED